MATESHALAWSWGWLNLQTRGEQLLALSMDEQPHPQAWMDSPHPAVAAVSAWLSGQWSAVDHLSLEPAGTEFQLRVWTAMQAIPPGETISYGALARQLGSGPRAVAGACRRNPIALVIPCHRVVAAHGIGGYSGQRDGQALARKRWLLSREGVHFPA